MATHLLWRDVCAMSKSLRKEIIAHGPDCITREGAQEIVCAIAPHYTSPAQPRKANEMGKYASPQQTLEVRKANAPHLPGGLLMGKQRISPKKLRWGRPNEIWINEQGLLDQVMLFGSLGAGKTETLLSMAFNAASDGKAVLYMDAKGNDYLYAKTVSALSERGLVGNLRVVNLMAGGHEKGLTSQQTHGIDLFDGFDDGNLAQWLLAMLPLKKDASEQQSHRRIAQSMFPVLARTVVAWAKQTGARITPFDIGSALTQRGLSAYCDVVAGVHGHTARELHARIWGDHAETGWATVAGEMFLQMQMLVRSFPRVFGGGGISGFDDQAPTVGLSHLYQSEGHRLFVVVLVPAMMKPPEDILVATRAITSALEQVLHNRSESTGCNTLVILDEFTLLEKPDGIARLSQIRNKGCGIVWGNYGTPSSDTVAHWRAAGWMPPHTHVVMKNEGDAITDSADYHEGGLGYLRWHMETQAGLVWPHDKRLSDFGPGQGLIWDGQQCVDILMDYQMAIHDQKTTFLVHAPPLPPATYTLSTGHVGWAMADAERQVRVLMDRHQEWILSHSNPPMLSWCQETLARMLGFANWHEAHIAIYASRDMDRS